MGPGYQVDIYYSLNNGITGYPERTNWDLAFSTGYNPNIRINSGNGITLFKVSNNTENWSSITSMPSNAVQLRNSNLNWQEGAFTMNEYGDIDTNWLEYNDSVNPMFQSGSYIYIINYGQESKKLKVNSFLEGTFNLTIANLDGSGEQNININTWDYTDKEFIYYSLANNEVIDREPISSDWDIVFTKYEEKDVFLNGDTMFYVVTGALVNSNQVAEHDGPTDIIPDYSVLNISNDINTIGYDWKQYNNGFTIVPNKSYYIFNQYQTSIYKINFQSFEGQVSGNTSFNIEELEYNINQEELGHDPKINIYPNPTSDNIVINNLNHTTKIKIINNNGDLVYFKTHNQSCKINLSKFQKGIYFINLANTNFNINKKIVFN